jgi:hypothetical protein
MSGSNEYSEEEMKYCNAMKKASPRLAREDFSKEMAFLVRLK